MKIPVNSLTNELRSRLTSAAYLNLSEETCKVWVKVVLFIYLFFFEWGLFWYQQVNPQKLVSFHDYAKTKIIHAFFVSNTFISNAWLKLAKNQANAKHHPEAELPLFENYSRSSSKFSSKNKQKTKCVCINEIIWLIIMKMKTKIKNRSYRYDTNRPRWLTLTQI